MVYPRQLAVALEGPNAMHLPQSHIGLNLHALFQFRVGPAHYNALWNSVDLEIGIQYLHPEEEVVVYYCRRSDSVYLQVGVDLFV